MSGVGRRRLLRARRIAIALAGALVLAAGVIYLFHRHDMQRIKTRLNADSRIVATSHGEVEYAAEGNGPVVLALHGAGGGYDQGRLLARAFGGDDFRWIAPSRFGYLRSTLPPDASTAAQAHTFAELLDQLGIDRVAILAMSGGVPPALQFARFYPERTTALVLLSSAPYAPFTAAQQKLPLPIWLYDALFRSDPPFWVLKRVARSSLERVFGVDPELRGRMSSDERAFVAGMVDAFLPVTLRTSGLRNEAAALDPAARIPLDRIRAPTLIIHARDDGIAPFAVGEYTATHVAGAELVPLDTGGHLLLGHHAAVAERVRSFLRAHGAPRDGEEAAQ